MSDGIIYVIIFSIGLYCGLKLEYKKEDKFIDDIMDDNVEKTYDNLYKTEKLDQEQINNNEFSNGLTPEIIDEWMNGSGKE